MLLTYTCLPGRHQSAERQALRIVSEVVRVRTNSTETLCKDTFQTPLKLALQSQRFRDSKSVCVCLCVCMSSASIYCMCFVQVSCKMFGWRGGQTLQGWAGWPGLRFLFPFRFLLLHNSSGPSLGVTCFCQYFSCKIVVRWKVKVVFVPEEESQESLTFSKRYHDSFSSHCVYNLSLHYVMYFNLATCRQTSSSIL